MTEKKKRNLRNPPRFNRNNIATWNFIIDNYLTYTVAMAVKNIFKYKEHEPLMSAEKSWVYIDKALTKVDIISTTYSSYAIENVRQSLKELNREDFRGLDDLQYQFILLSLQTVTMNRSDIHSILMAMKKISEEIILSLIFGRTLNIEKDGRVQELVVTGMDAKFIFLEYSNGQSATLEKQEAIGYLYSVVK